MGIPKAVNVDVLYLSLASEDVKSRLGGGGAVFGERKNGNWILVESRKWRWNQGRVMCGAEKFLVFDSTENVVGCGIGRGGWVSERRW